MYSSVFMSKQTKSVVLDLTKAHKYGSKAENKRLESVDYNESQMIDWVSGRQYAWEMNNDNCSHNDLSCDQHRRHNFGWVESFSNNEDGFSYRSSLFEQLPQRAKMLNSCSHLKADERSQTIFIVENIHSKNGSMMEGKENIVRKIKSFAKEYITAMEHEVIFTHINSELSTWTPTRRELQIREFEGDRHDSTNLVVYFGSF